MGSKFLMRFSGPWGHTAHTEQQQQRSSARDAEREREREADRYSRDRAQKHARSTKRERDGQMQPLCSSPQLVCIYIVYTTYVYRNAPLARGGVAIFHTTVRGYDLPRTYWYIYVPLYAKIYTRFSSWLSPRDRRTRERCTGR